MNIRKRMLKVANNLMEDVIKSFEMTEEEWKKYNELHPNSKRENHQIVPDRKNNGGNGEKIDIQKIHKNTTFLKKIFNEIYFDEEKSGRMAREFSFNLARGADKKKIVEQINYLIPRSDLEISEKDLF